MTLPHPDIGPSVRIAHYHRPDHRAEAAAMSVMESAFDPMFGEAWTASQLAGFMAMPGVTLAIASLDHAWLGFALSRVILHEAELLLLATHRNWQRRGIGNLLLGDFMSSARKSRIETLHLEVRVNNPAVEFYSSNGFECVHRRPTYYRGRNGDLFDALSFRKILS